MNLSRQSTSSVGGFLLSRQTSHATIHTIQTVSSTALPPAVLQFYGDDIVAEMWEVALSLEAVDHVSSLVKISVIRDLVKFLRHVNNKETKFVIDEKSLWKEVNRWDSDDWISFGDILKILQRSSKHDKTISVLQGPTANKDAIEARMNMRDKISDAKLKSGALIKPILMNRCCAHAACQSICSFSYTNTTEGNLGHNGDISIATADGVFHTEFIPVLFDKKRKAKAQNPAIYKNSGNDDDVNITMVLDAPDEDQPNAEESEASSKNSENEDDGFSRKDMFRLNVAYSRVLANRPRGRLLVGDVLDVMKEAGLSYDLSKLSMEAWDAAQHLLIESLDSVIPLMKRIRKDEELLTGPLAHLIKYPVPLWLQQEFSQAELLLYQHHFMLIDIDGGGTIDADELQQLLNSFCGDGGAGSYKVSTAEANEIVQMFDIDGGGTLDFVEFLVLIYRIQRGTMNKEFLSSPAGSLLVKALTEAKRQLYIFEEIEEVGLHPPRGCSVLSFGGSPVLCIVAIQVQPIPLGEGGDVPASLAVPVFITVHITMHDGYPYRPPDVQIKEPGIVHPLCIRALDGSCRLLHLTRLWQCQDRLTEEERALLQAEPQDDLCANNLESLLRHLSILLKQPAKIWSLDRCVDWLPSELGEIYQSWRRKLESLRQIQDSTENSTVNATPKKAFSVTDLSDPPTLRKFTKLPRLQQMHAGMLLVFLQDRHQYFALAQSIMQFKRVLEG